MMNLFKSKSNKNKHLICIHLFPLLNKIKMVRCAVSKLFSSLILLCRFKNWRVATNVSNNFNTMTNREQKVIKMKQAKDKDILINIISTYLKRSKAELNTFPFSEKYKYLKPLPLETETNRILVCSPLAVHQVFCAFSSTYSCICLQERRKHDLNNVPRLLLVYTFVTFFFFLKNMVFCVNGVALWSSFHSLTQKIKYGQKYFFLDMCI